MRDRDWAGPFIGRILINREKSVLFERLTNHSDKLILPSKQWIPKVAFKSSGISFDVSTSFSGEYFIAKWFIKRIYSRENDIPHPAEVQSKSEMIEDFRGRKRLLRPVLEPAQQKRMEERFTNNVDEFLAKAKLVESFPYSHERLGSWTRSARGGEQVFICEASDNVEICPKCKKSFRYDKPTFREIGQEGEVQAWHFKHSCGAELVVLND